MSLLRSYLLKRQAGKPVVLISLQRRYYPPPLKPLLKKLLPDLVLALSNASVAALTSLGAKATRIPLGVDLERYRPASPETRARLREKYGLPQRKILLHVGHLTRRRNLDAFLQLAGPRTHLLMVSSTSTRHEIAHIKQACANLTLIDKYIESIEEIYQASDAYVFPTLDDKGAIELPLSILEAMATNLPVITTPFGGIPDVFREVAGLVICTDAVQFTAAIDRLDELEVCTRQAIVNFSWQDVATEIIRTIEANLQ